MAKINVIPLHVATTMLPSEAFDLIVALDTYVTEFAAVESVVAFTDALKAAYSEAVGDVPNFDPNAPPDEDGGSTVAAK